MNNVMTSTVARCKGCGRIIFAAVDEPSVLDSCKEDMMGLIRDGYDLTHVEHQVVREQFGCECAKQMNMFNCMNCE